MVWLVSSASSLGSRPCVFDISCCGSVPPLETDLCVPLPHYRLQIGISKKPYIFPPSSLDLRGPAHWRSSAHSLVSALKTRLLIRGSWIGLYPPSHTLEGPTEDSSRDSSSAIEPSGYLGAALVPSASSRTAVFVSTGHLVSLETSVRLTVMCSKTKIPEPVRRADLEGREQVRQWVGERTQGERNGDEEVSR